MTRTLKFALRYDPDNSLLDWPADKRVAQHDQRLLKAIA